VDANPVYLATSVTKWVIAYMTAIHSHPSKSSKRKNKSQSTLGKAECKFNAGSQNSIIYGNPASNCGNEKGMEHTKKASLFLDNRLTCATLNQTDTNHDWDAETGASSHMTPHWKWIREYQPMCIPIKLDNNTIIYPEGVSTVILQLSANGRFVENIELTWVLHIQGINHNLLSVIHMT